MKKVINKYNGKNVMVLQMNNYVKPNPSQLLTQSGKHVTNGIDNSYFYEVEDRYLGSPTNQAVIDSYANFIYGEGLIAIGANLSDYISKSDIRLLIKDLKMQGAFCIQVIYNESRTAIAKLHHITVKSIAIDKQQDISDDPTGYWYSFDWRNKSKFKPQFIPAFGMSEELTELAYFRIPSPQPLFSLPDYQSGLQYCQLEEELSNFYINHVKNNFSAGKIVNVNQGIPETDEAQEEAERAILSKVKGTSNAGNIIISFNDNKENATTVDSVEITNAYEQFSALSIEARDKILMAHKVVNPILFGVKDGGGLGNNADEMTVALKTLYRSQINPMREIFIDGLEEVFKFNGGSLKFEFIDFEELTIKEKVAVAAPANVVDVNAPAELIVDDKTAEAQASLKGSVGGVSALLSIQQSFANGLTDYDSAITMLKVIFGYDDKTAKDLLGAPKLQEDVPVTDNTNKLLTD